jgi:hypothetical protein
VTGTATGPAILPKEIIHMKKRMIPFSLAGLTGSSNRE